MQSLRRMPVRLASGLAGAITAPSLPGVRAKHFEILSLVKSKPMPRSASRSPPPMDLLAGVEQGQDQFTRGLACRNCLTVPGTRFDASPLISATVISPRRGLQILDLGLGPGQSSGSGGYGRSALRPPRSGSAFSAAR